MTIKFDQTIDDVVEFSRFYYFGRYKGLKNRAYIYVVIMIIVFGMNIWNNSFDISWPSLLPFAIIILIVLLFQSKWYYKWRVSRTYKNGLERHFEGVRTILLKEESLFCKTPYIESVYSWKSFESLRETKKYFFLIITMNQAIIIPKRIFLLPQEEYDVKSFIERKLAEQN